MTRHARAGYIETTLDMAGMTYSEDTTHKDLRSSEIRCGQKDLQTQITAFHNFINQFEVEVKEDLFCISSDARAQAEVANDILNAEAVGKAAFKTSMQNRLVAQTLKFNASLPRQSLKTLGSLEKTKKLKSSKIVQISAQRNLFGLLILSEDNNHSVQKVLQYPLGSTLATPDGFPLKPYRAKLKHQLEDDAMLVHHHCLDDLGAYVVDGNTLLHTVTVLPQTFGELSKKLSSMLPKVKTVDFVTDTYKENSIKSAE